MPSNSFLKSVKYCAWLFIFLACLFPLNAHAAQDTILFDNAKSGIPFRIPAIAQANNGDIIALSDYRKCKADIGYGEVDIIGRISQDNGKTWSEHFVIAAGNGKKNDNACGYGDACIVADRLTDEVLVMAVTGNVVYFSSTQNNPNRVALIRGKFDKKTSSWQWSEPQDVTEEIYSQLPEVKGLFFTSGRILQSRIVKKDKFFRLYAGLCTLSGNFVMYSDDFGGHWNVLGSNRQSCIADGDECKCEELPDGSVLLSSRTDFGRIFNVFKFTDIDNAIGSWQKEVKPSKDNNGIYNSGTACNGEILLISAVRKSDNRNVHLLLQSVVAREGRNDVTVYYKELKFPDDYSSAENIAKDWDGKFQISHTSSAYSTMIQLQDETIAVYFEENAFNGGYDMRYCTFTIETITQNKFSAL